MLLLRRRMIFRDEDMQGNKRVGLGGWGYFLEWSSAPGAKP